MKVRLLMCWIRARIGALSVCLVRLISTVGLKCAVFVGILIDSCVASCRVRGAVVRLLVLT